MSKMNQGILLTDLSSDKLVALTAPFVIDNEVLIGLPPPSAEENYWRIS